MSSIKNIQAKIDQMEKLKKEIEATKKNINSALGETLIKDLNLDYEELSSKKEISKIVKKIKESLPNDFSKNQGKSSNEANIDSEQKKNIHNSHQQSNNHSNY
ncbi:MAG: hypothetical protein KC455_11330 [Carnobacterium sp.]|nr:hypothetical protein [Carnobacterium sp.]